MSLGGQNLTDEDIRRYIAMQSAAPAGPAPAPMPYNDPTFLAQQAILARPMRPSFTGQQLISREVPVGLQGNSGLAYPSMQQSGLLNVPSYTSRYAGTDSGNGGGTDAVSGGWSSMTPAEQASYYDANPNMAAATRAGQSIFGFTMPGMLQSYMDPGLIRDQGLIALGIDPSVAAAQETGRQNAQEGFRAAEYGLMNQFSPESVAENVAANAQAMQSMQDAQVADTNAANGYGSDAGGYGTGDSAGFGGGTDSGSDGW
jgi:hypothetical protein